MSYDLNGHSSFFYEKYPSHKNDHFIYGYSNTSGILRDS